MDNKERKEHNKKVILTYLKQSGALYNTGNMYHAQKAFVINSVLKWVLNKVDSGDYDYNDVTFYIQSMNDYVNGDLRVYWSEDGSLVIGA